MPLALEQNIDYLGERDSSIFLLGHCYKYLKRKSPLLTSFLGTNCAPPSLYCKPLGNLTFWVSDYFLTKWAFIPSAPLVLFCSTIPMISYPSLIQLYTNPFFLDCFLLLDFGTALYMFFVSSATLTCHCWLYLNGNLLQDSTTFLPSLLYLCSLIGRALNLLAFNAIHILKMYF